MYWFHVERSPSCVYSPVQASHAALVVGMTNSTRRVVSRGALAPNSICSTWNRQTHTQSASSRSTWNAYLADRVVPCGTIGAHRLAPMSTLSLISNFTAGIRRYADAVAFFAPSRMYRLSDCGTAIGSPHSHSADIRISSRSRPPTHSTSRLADTSAFAAHFKNGP